MTAQVRVQEAKEGENKAAYDDIRAPTNDLLRRAVAEEKRQKTLLDRAVAAVAVVTAETNAKRAQREAARVPAVRAADVGKPILPRRGWKPSQRHVEARASLARDMAASAPSSSVAASSAEAAAEAARSSAAAAATALRVTPSTVTATISASAATPSAPAVSPPPRPPPVPAVTTARPTSTPVAVGPGVVGDDPVVGLCLYQSPIGILFVGCETVTHLRRCGGTRSVPRELIIKLYVVSNLMIGVTTCLGRKSPSAALRNSTSKLDFENLLCFSSEPDGSPDYVTSVSVSEPAMHLPPVYVDGQIY